jgi:hypothetical protein
MTAFAFPAVIVVEGTSMEDAYDKAADILDTLDEQATDYEVYLPELNENDVKEATI